MYDIQLDFWDNRPQTGAFVIEAQVSLVNATAAATEAHRTLSLCYTSSTFIAAPAVTLTQRSIGDNGLMGTYRTMM